MRFVKIQNLKNQALIAEKCVVAESFSQRLFGLMSRSALGEKEGMLFPNCKSIHMWFMRFPIDVIFLRSDHKVSSTYSHAKPWKLLPISDLRADSVIEVPAGTLSKIQILPGDELCIN